MNSIGIFQYQSRRETPTDRIERLDQAIKKIKEKVDIIVCPELFMSGYGNAEDIKKYAEKSKGSFAESISNLAKKFNLSIIYGYPELEGDKLYNSAQCFDNKGAPLANHRKTVLPKTSNENEIFYPGQKNSIINIAGLKIALVICYELEFPEIIRNAAFNKVDLVIAPTGQSDLWPAAARYIPRSRAFENGIFVAYANSCGKNNGINFMGESKIINPKGLDVVFAKDKEELIIGEIDLNLISSVRKKLPYLDDVKGIKKY
ncbi:MAG: nitrilase-related carbon-nitrogen hydrolase [Pelagibacteraceae bacterium]|nr:nitrilase-related carbon-nitrogen hydrolase [Pelagibacteraceae bacterium]